MGENDVVFFLHFFSNLTYSDSINIFAKYREKFIESQRYAYNHPGKVPSFYSKAGGVAVVLIPPPISWRCLSFRPDPHQILHCPYNCDRKNRRTSIQNLSQLDMARPLRLNTGVVYHTTSGGYEKIKEAVQIYASTQTAGSYRES